MCRFLEERYSHLMEQDASSYVQAIHGALKSANSMLRLIYSHGLWLQRQDAKACATLGLQFASHYLQAAHEALALSRTRFKLSPKYHAFQHIIQYLMDELEIQDAVYIQSPLQWSTQQDEDFVGRVSQLSCAVSSRTVHRQCMARYGANLWEHWDAWQS